MTEEKYFAECLIIANGPMRIKLQLVLSYYQLLYVKNVYNKNRRSTFLLKKLVNFYHFKIIIEIHK